MVLYSPQGPLPLYKAHFSLIHSSMVYVDDVLLTGTHETDINVVKQFLHTKFTIKDLGYSKYFLGIEIAWSSTATSLNQRKYILEILEDIGLLWAKHVTTPLPKTLKLTTTGEAFLDSKCYRWLFGHLLYLNLTRPDIPYAVQKLSQFVGSPTHQHWEATIHILRYLKGCNSKGLSFLQRAHSNWKHIVMLARLHVLIQGRVWQDMVSFFAHPSSLVKLINKPLFQDLLLKQNIEVWLVLSMSYNGFLTSIRIFKSLQLYQSLYYVTIRRPFTLLPILSFINIQSILKLIATLFEINIHLGLSIHSMFLPHNSWPTFSPKA